MSEYEYQGKALSQYTLDELVWIKAQLNAAETKREEASKHPKFDVLNNKKAVGKFPPPNPEFLKLKTAILEEIRKRDNA